MRAGTVVNKAVYDVLTPYGYSSDATLLARYKFFAVNLHTTL